MSRCKIPSLTILKLAIPIPQPPFSIPVRPKIPGMPKLPGCPLD